MLHWPGNFGKYFAYSDSARSGGHPVTQVADYALWFWWPHAGAWAVAAILVLAAAGAAWRMPAGRPRRFCLALLAVNAASTVAFLAYTATGIDEVNQYYIGYFYWSAPVVMVLVVLLAGTELLAARWPGIGNGPGQRRCLCASPWRWPWPAARRSPSPRRPGSPRTTPTRATRRPPGRSRTRRCRRASRGSARSPPDATRCSPSRSDAWPAITGILVQAERTGVPACVAGPAWEFMMTSQFICTRKETARRRCDSASGRRVPFRAVCRWCSGFGGA